MRLADGRLAFTATDLSRHVACRHLTTLRRGVALGEIGAPPPYDDPPRRRAEAARHRTRAASPGAVRGGGALGGGRHHGRRAVLPPGPGSCAERRRADDHLSLVAGSTRGHRARLVERGVTTMAALGAIDLPVVPRLDGVGAGALARIRDQARAQGRGRREGRRIYELVTPVEPDKGLAAPPEPSAGDIFFDLEGDPFAARRPPPRGPAGGAGLGRELLDLLSDSPPRWARVRNRAHRDAFST